MDFNKIPPEEIFKEANYLYIHNPDFHAKVGLIYFTNKRVFEQTYGRKMDKLERDSAKISIALAVLYAETHPRQY